MAFRTSTRLSTRLRAGLILSGTDAVMGGGGETMLEFYQTKAGRKFFEVTIPGTSLAGGRAMSTGVSSTSTSVDQPSGAGTT